MKVRKIKLLIFKAALLGFALLLAIGLSNYAVVKSTKKQIYSNEAARPAMDIAIVLGASKYLRNQSLNPYFINRIEAAARLYNKGKVKHVLVSGDNHTHSYNEPQDMKDMLMTLGVPDSCITMDFAGFRTFDSMIRAKEVFGVSKCVIISQTFHLERALFIANSNKIEAIGFSAKDPHYQGVNVREIFAKFKAVLDCYLLPTKPKFLGNKITLGN